MEIERKFLVPETPGPDDDESTEIEQGYLALARREGGPRCGCEVATAS